MDAEANPDTGPELEGPHEHTVDDKGRVSIPAEFRGLLEVGEGDELVVTRPLADECLFVFRPDAWAAYKRKAEALPPAIARHFGRVVGGMAKRVKLDRLGRIQLPQVLRKYAHLDGKCFVIGKGHRMEIWAEDVWMAATAPEVFAQLDLGQYDI